MNRRTRWTTLATLAMLSLTHSDSRGGNPPTPCTSLVHFAQSSYSVTEEQGLVTLTVVRETCLNQEVTVQYQCTNGSAVLDQDYTAVSGTLTFPVNAEYRYIHVPIINDSASESSELFTVALSNPTNASLTTPGTATVTISDGVPAVSISASPTSGLESSEPTAKFTVSLSEAPSSTVTVPISLGGTATRYGANIITDPSLESSTDRWWLNSENNKGAFTRAGEGAFFGSSGAKFSATTMDGWMIPSYKLDLDISTGGLAIQPHTLSFYARAEATRTLWAHIAGTNGLDLMADLGNVTVTPAWKRYTITFTPLHNGAASANHYPHLRFSAFADDLPLTLYIDGLKLEPGNSASKFGDYEFFGKNLISNSDLESAGTNWSLNSGGGDAAFSRVNTTAYSGTYSAKYSATTFSGWLIPTYNVWSDIHPDGLSTTDQYAISYYAKMDAARTLSGTIGNGNGTGALAYFGEVEFGTSWKRYEYFFTPANNGAAPNYPGIKLEALSNDVPFTLYWDKLQLQKVTPQSSVTFAPGETTKILEMPVIDDRIFEAGETIIVDLDTPVGADRSATQGSATFTITNDEDPPTASFPTSSSTKSEGETASFTVALSHDNTEVNVSVPFSYSGTAVRNTDYLAPSNISIASGAISGTLEIDAAEDAIDEDNETAIATIGTSSTATLTIVDENPAPTVQLSASTATVNEDAQTIQVTAQLSTQSGKTVTVQYATASGTAASDEDFTLTTGTVTINPGQTAKSFSVPVTIDCKTESSETFSVALSNPSNATLGATTSQTITITDGTPCARIEVSPSEIVFPDHDISPGPSDPIYAEISNVGNAALVFQNDAVEITGGSRDSFTTFFFTDTGKAFTLTDIVFTGSAPRGPSTADLLPGETRDIGLVFNPYTVGPKTADLVIRTNSVNSPVLVLPIQGAAINRAVQTGGAGMGSPVDLYPRSMDFRNGEGYGWTSLGYTFQTLLPPTNSALPFPEKPIFRSDGYSGLMSINRYDENYRNLVGADQVPIQGSGFGYWHNADDATRYSFAPHLNSSGGKGIIIRMDWEVSAARDYQLAPPTEGEDYELEDRPIFRLRVNHQNLNEHNFVVIESRPLDPQITPSNGTKRYTTYTYADPRASTPQPTANSDFYIPAFDILSTNPGAGGIYGATVSLAAITADKISYPAASRFEQPLLQDSFIGGQTAGWEAAQPVYPPAPDPRGSAAITLTATASGLQIKATGSARDGKAFNWGFASWYKELTSGLDPGGVYRVTATVSSSAPAAYVPDFRIRLSGKDDYNFSSVASFVSQTQLLPPPDDPWAAPSAGREYEAFFQIPEDYVREGAQAPNRFLLAFDAVPGIDEQYKTTAYPTPPNDVEVTLRAIRVEKVKRPSTVACVSPAGGAKTTGWPSYQFNRLTDEEAELVDSYLVEVSSDSGFTSTEHSHHIEVAGLSGSTVNYQPTQQLGNGVKYWRVRALDKFGQYSDPPTSVSEFHAGRQASVFLGTTQDGIYQVNLETGAAIQITTESAGPAMAVDPRSGDLVVQRAKQVGLSWKRGIAVYSSGAAQPTWKQYADPEESSDEMISVRLAFRNDGVLFGSSKPGNLFDIDYSGTEAVVGFPYCGSIADQDFDEYEKCVLRRKLGVKIDGPGLPTMLHFGGNFAWEWLDSSGGPSAFSLEGVGYNPVLIPGGGGDRLLQFTPNGSSNNNGYNSSPTCGEGSHPAPCAEEPYLSRTWIASGGWPDGLFPDTEVLLRGMAFNSDNHLMAARTTATGLVLYVIDAHGSNGLVYTENEIPLTGVVDFDPLDIYTVAFDCYSPSIVLPQPDEALEIVSIRCRQVGATSWTSLPSVGAPAQLQPGAYEFAIKSVINPTSDPNPTPPTLQVSPAIGGATTFTHFSYDSATKTHIYRAPAGASVALSQSSSTFILNTPETGTSATFRVADQSANLSLSQTPRIVR